MVTGIGFLDDLLGFTPEHEILRYNARKYKRMNEGKKMEIQAGKYYTSRGGQIFGPLEAEPKALENDGVWVWRTKYDGDWMHWTRSGKWYQDPTKESANDLVEEAEIVSSAEWTVAELMKAREQLDAADAKERKEALGPMTKHRLLDLAKETTADRGLNYGKPEDNFARIAEHWTAFLLNKGHEVRISADDVAIMCALLKIARLEHMPGHQDSWVDLAGYAACGAEIALAPTAHSNTSVETDDWLWRAFPDPRMPPQFDGSERVQYGLVGGGGGVGDARQISWEKVIKFRVVS